MEGERLRPHIEELLQYADYVVTSTHFPQVGGSIALLLFSRVACKQSSLQVRTSIVLEAGLPGTFPLPFAV